MNDHDETGQAPRSEWTASLKRMILPESSINQPTSGSDPNHDDEGEVDTPPGCLFRVRVGPRGRGLFATASIPPLTAIHTAPCVRVSKDDYDGHMRYTILEHYLFNDPTSGAKLLALGYGSLFNHSRQPNVNYRVDSTKNNNAATITYTSGPKQIPKGEELCISYGSNLLFEDADGLGSESSDSCEEAIVFLGHINVMENEEER